MLEWGGRGKGCSWKKRPTFLRGINAIAKIGSDQAEKTSARLKVWKKKDFKFFKGPTFGEFW